MIHPHNRREPNFNRRDQVFTQGWRTPVPEGWERVTRGLIRPGDRLWHRMNPPRGFAYVGQCDIGARVEFKYCVLRKINTTETEAPNGFESPS